MQLFESNFFYLIGYSSLPSVSLNSESFYESDLSGMLGLFNEADARKKAYIDYWGLDVRLNCIAIYDELIENRTKLINWLENNSIDLKYFYLISKLDKTVSPSSSLYLDIKCLKIMNQINSNLDACEITLNALMDLQLSVLSNKIEKKLKRSHWYFDAALRKLNLNLKLKSSIKA